MNGTNSEHRSADLPLLKVSSDRRYIVTADGAPFFWLGGTAWELIHRLTREEIDLYFADRAEKGFTVIQTVVLAELDGLNTPNAYGERPLIENDPTRLNEKYFEYVDYVLKRAQEFGLYIALLPTWGDKFNRKWGAGPEIFNPENAEAYGALLGERYLSFDNLVWILGGDRVPERNDHAEVIRAMARGIREADERHLISYHPLGRETASDYFNEEWLDFDMFQSGHDLTGKDWEFVANSRRKTPARPVVDGEARYENIPDRFWEKDDLVWMTDADVRITAYWSMLAGAAGYTYGCNDVWQMYQIDRDPVIHARTDWRAAIHLPGSTHMTYMKQLLTAFPWQEMDTDQSLILNENPRDETHIVGAIGRKKDFVLVYTPFGSAVQPNLSAMDAARVRAYWYNPRSGRSKEIGIFTADGIPVFEPWSRGKGSDFVLVLVDANAGYVVPGLDS